MSYCVLDVTYQLTAECPDCGFTMGASRQEQRTFVEDAEVHSRQGFKCNCGYRFDVFLGTQAKRIDSLDGCLMLEGEVSG